MGYVERVLQPGETLLARTRLHWWAVYPRAALLLVLALGLAAFALSRPGEAANPSLLAAGVALVLAILFAAAGAVRRATTEYAVTNRRIIHKTGLLRRHTVEMQRSQVESVDVDQSLFGRLFDYGDVTLRGSGTTWEPFRMIAAPLAFRSAITAG